MQVQRIDPWTLEFKTKSLSVVVNQTVSIGSIVIDGPGEYDVAGISVQGLAAEKQTIYVMRIEDLNICVVPRFPEVLSASQLDQIGTVDVAVIPVVSGGEMNQSLALSNSLEPRLLLVIGDGDASSVHSTAQVDEESIKISSAALLQDERQIVVLKPEHS